MENSAEALQKIRSKPQYHPAIARVGVYLQQMTTSIREARTPTCHSSAPSSEDREHPKTVKEWMATVVAARVHEEILSKHENEEILL